MTDEQLDELRQLSECVQIMAAQVLARRTPGHTILVREISVLAGASQRRE